jgi:hypothetical protein
LSGVLPVFGFGAAGLAGASASFGVSAGVSANAIPEDRNSDSASAAIFFIASLFF